MNQDEIIETIQEQLMRDLELEFYRKRFQRFDINPKKIRTLEDFRKIPCMTLDDLASAYMEKPPLGSLVHPRTRRVNLSPSPIGFLPMLFSDRDIEIMNLVNADAFRAAGVRSEDVIAVTFGYHLFIAGLSLQGGFEKLGCKTIPVGPGEAKRTAEIINRFGVTVLASGPSFALRCSEEGAKGIRILIAGGEPFSSVDGFKDRVRESLGQITLIDTYGLAQVSPLARECKEETGLHILDEWVYVEIIDPDTEEVLPNGERGEVVVTNLQKEASPLLRYRTGDLSTLDHIKCSCGRSATLPKGIIGSTTEMHKMKGVKVYPSQMGAILKTIPGASGKYRFVLSTSGTTDYVKLLIEGDTPPNFNISQLREKIKQALLIYPNELTIERKIGEGPSVVDERY